MKTITKIEDWHEQRNLVNGSTDPAQFVKALEELMEVYASIRPKVPPAQLVGEVKGMLDELLYKGRIKPEIEYGDGLKDGLGDVVVVLVNIAKRNGYKLEDCIKHSYGEIKDRKGLMKNGVYVKYEDLTEDEQRRFK